MLTDGLVDSSGETERTRWVLKSSPFYLALTFFWNATTDSGRYIGFSARDVFWKVVLEAVMSAFISDCIHSIFFLPIVFATF